MSLRLEFVHRALAKEANISQLCREFGISRKTGHKWLRRYLEEGKEGLVDQSRRPHNSPKRTPHEVEQKVLRVRDEHPAWGGRKIHQRLKRLGANPIPPPPSTITEILRRHGRIAPEEGQKHRAWQRFEAEQPNAMWQMDFKGHFPLSNGNRCHPLTLLDDHSRFCLGLQACEDERRDTVRQELTGIFQRHGLPDQLLVDNGPPWGTDPRHRLTFLGVPGPTVRAGAGWLVRLGIHLIHTRAYHPQTIGKEERFHRTLSEEVLRHHSMRNLEHAQRCFDPWRQVYNHERPHEGIGMLVPAERYQPSTKPYPETPPLVVYDPGTMVRRVDKKGRISFHNKLYKAGKALRGQPVAIRPVDIDGRFEVYFCEHKVAMIDLGTGS